MHLSCILSHSISPTFYDIRRVRGTGKIWNIRSYLKIDRKSKLNNNVYIIVSNHLEFWVGERYSKCAGTFHRLKYIHVSSTLNTFSGFPLKPRRSYWCEPFKEVIQHSMITCICPVCLEWLSHSSCQLISPPFLEPIEPIDTWFAMLNYKPWMALNSLLVLMCR